MSRPLSTCALLPGLLILALLGSHASWASEHGEPDALQDDFDEVELIPDDPPSASLSHVLAPITGIFMGGWGYWYDNRVITVETTPPGAVIDLFYVRRNFQKAYEQADSPARVILPARIEATPRDSVTIRALLDGYKQKEVRLKVRSRDEHVMIDLAPLPNSLVALTHTYFAGRGTLTFLTKEQLTFRLQKSGEGFGVVLTETAGSPDARETMVGVSSALVRSVSPQQLGEDLVVRVSLTDQGRDEGLETRSRQSVDPVRGLHSFALDFVPEDGGAAAVSRARDALSRISAADATGCALEFDSGLRERLDPADLARALTPNGSYTDKYMRAAMKRLGEVSPDGVIRMIDGSTFRGSVPIELMAAATQPGHAVGYLSVLRRFVAELESQDYRRSTLRGLVAPELAPARFETIMDAAENDERSCRGQTAGTVTGPS